MRAPYLLFLHGFASCGAGHKSRLLATWFGPDRLLAPDLPASPRTAIDRAGSLIERHRVDLLVGSSLGGYYATWLAAKHGLKAVLVNPSVRPYETLADRVGRHRWWCRDSYFDWTAADVAALRHYRVDPAPDRLLVLLQTGDEVLDYRQAQDHYRHARLVVERGGNHRFENLADYRSLIERFRAS